MWDTYEEYCSFMASKNCDPLGEEIFNRDYRRKSEEEKEAERIAHIPFVSRKKDSFRNVEPTLSNHDAPRASAPLKVNLMDRVAAHGKTIKERKVKKPKEPKEKKPLAEKVRKAPPRRKSDEEKEETKRLRMEREYANRRLKRIENRIAKGLPPVKTNLKAMSDEERKQHLKALRKAEVERIKKKMESDPEYCAKKKELGKIHQRNYSQKNPGRMKRWAKSNPEKIKEFNRQWREKNREKLRANAKRRREEKKAEDPNFLIREREKAKALRDRKRGAVNVSWSAESGCAA